MLILGHRGASAIAPENTVLALRAAIDAGAAGSEFDVRMTADGVCVCTHDATVVINGGPRLICEVAFEELSGDVATLAQAFDALAGGQILAELKNHPWDPCYDPSQRLATELSRIAPSGAIVGCFDPSALAFVRGVRADLKTAVITSAAFDPSANLDAAVAGDHEICSVEHSAVTAEFVTRAHGEGKLVYAWATDEAEAVQRLDAIGVDALMCDDPAKALSALNG